MDCYFVKRGVYRDDLFKTEGGVYAYARAWNRPALITLALGIAVHWVVAFGLPAWRERYTAALPSLIVTGSVCYLWGGPVWLDKGRRIP